MPDLLATAPNAAVTEYDRRMLPIYAALLDAEAAGTDWRESAADVMQLDPQDEASLHCWKSHLERARWIVGSGLTSAIQAFSHPSI